MHGTAKNKLNKICEEMERDNMKVQLHNGIDNKGYMGKLSDTRSEGVSNTETK